MAELDNGASGFSPVGRPAWSVTLLWPGTSYSGTASPKPGPVITQCSS
jgi:hypothetical protein